MEEEFKQESRRKPVGWRRQSLLHRLAAKGYKVKNVGNARMEKAKRLSEQDELTWAKFKELFGSKSEDLLDEMISKGKIEVDAEECDPDSKQWANETRLEIQEGDETSTVSINDDTHIKILEG